MRKELIGSGSVLRRRGCRKRHCNQRDLCKCQAHLELHRRLSADETHGCRQSGVAVRQQSANPHEILPARPQSLGGGLTEASRTRWRQTRLPSAVTTSTSYATALATGSHRMMKSEACTVAPGRGNSTTGRETPGDPLRTDVSASEFGVLGMPGACRRWPVATETGRSSAWFRCASRHSAAEMATTAIAAATPAHRQVTGEFLCAAVSSCLAPAKNRGGTDVATP